MKTNEPVAYAMFKDDEFYDAIHPDEQAKTVGEYDIPLYTHPAKPLSNVVVASATCSCGKVMEVTNLQEAKTLTDEEIKELAYQHRWNGDVEFARAILRKAQEK
jgi:serine kinase of HPr protein (carbohydrate metabolism regulator)